MLRRFHEVGHSDETLRNEYLSHEDVMRISITEIRFLFHNIYTMFLRKTSWKDFTGFIKAAKVEIELLKETNKFLDKATNLNPLMKWYKRKFWYPSPQGLLMEAEIRQINIQIDQDWVHIQWYWTDGVTYDELAFFDKESAQDMAELVAWTYVEKLKKDKEFYEDMLRRTDEAIAYAKLPPEDKANAQLTWPVEDDKEMKTFWDLAKEVQWSLATNKKAQWTKQRKQSKKNDQ